MKVTLDEDTAAIVRSVEAVVSPVYLVGGSVRDILLSARPHDYDFTTPLRPDEIESRVRAAGKKPRLIGKRFGTVGFSIGRQFIEVTTFRTESYTPGSRKPQVEFIADITHDLSRRDFTINAMALRTDGTLVDPFGGRADLTNKIIRTVNKPYDRYNEDPLRMLRTARFAAQLGFDIEAETQRQAGKKASKILEISRERWTMELDKLLLGEHAGNGLWFLADTRLLHFLLPELAVQLGYDQDSPYHELDLWEHTLKTVRLTERDPVLRWAALLHDIGKPFAAAKNQKGYTNYTHHDQIGAEMILKIGPYLKWSTVRTNEIAAIIRGHLSPTSPLHDADSAARFR